MTGAALKPARKQNVAVRRHDLRRIRDALRAAAELVRSLDAPSVVVEFKTRRRGPVTVLDRRINELLRERLPGLGEGWLSEESRDDHSRLGKSRVWVVDPLDGTREFIEGIPEWCISIGLVEDGQAVAGGVSNPATGETFLGAVGLGVTLNGHTVPVRPCRNVRQAVVLASRSELARGDWPGEINKSLFVQPAGSVAYKLARVAAGLADATWTYVPKHEWDVAAGVALVTAAGGVVKTLGGRCPTFNQRVPLFEGLMAFSSSSHGLLEAIALRPRQMRPLSA